MAMEDLRLRFEGFLEVFREQHVHHHTRPFCFVLGAGASISSGIPSAGEMVQRWLTELHRANDFTSSPFEPWVRNTFGIEDFTCGGLAAFYPLVHARRFPNPIDGYRDLEREMCGKVPSWGYGVLAQILAATQHKVVITTNFDNLVSDALLLFTRTTPLICGHESLARFVSSRPNRPVIAKIHRDLLLEPMNDVERLASLERRWRNPIASILEYFTPIFIGYGGNDGSLMGLLGNLRPKDIPGGIYWCYRDKPGATVPSAVRNIVARYRGRLIPIPGFDAMMLHLKRLLGLKSPQTLLTEHHLQLDSACREQAIFLGDVDEPALASDPSPPANSFGPLRQDWKEWQRNADQEIDLDRRENVYQAALSDLPDSPDLHRNFALFQGYVRHKPDDAEKHFRRAFELAPDELENRLTLAEFLAKVRAKHDEAERLYQEAWSSTPTPTIAEHCGTFFFRVRRNLSEAERFFREAYERSKRAGNHAANLAFFLSEGRQDHRAAGTLYRFAVRKEANNARLLSHYARFLAVHCAKPTEARRLFQSALLLAPDDPTVVCHYACFLSRNREEYSLADQLFRRALQIDGASAWKRLAFASFLTQACEKHDEAEEHFKLALVIHPNNTAVAAEYGGFLWRVRSQGDKAIDLLRQSLEIDPLNRDAEKLLKQLLKRSKPRVPGVRENSGNSARKPAATVVPPRPPKRTGTN